MSVGKFLRESLAFGMVVVLSLLYLIESRRAQGIVDLQAAAQRADVAGLRKWIEVEMERSHALARVLAREMEALRRRPIDSNTPRERSSTETEAASLPIESPSEVEPVVDPGPPLPPQVGDPLVCLRSLDPEKFFSDPGLYEEPRDLGRTDKLRVGCELAIARAKVDILDKEIQLICAENLDRMRAAGEYMEYEKGQPCESMGKGVITFGEVTERGSTRIFAFHPEEFGEIYEKKTAQRAVAEGLVRKLLALGGPTNVAGSPREVGGG